MADKLKSFSDAIKLGATFKPQCFEMFAINGKSCALQAAAEAMGFENGHLAYGANEFSKRFPAVNKWIQCPCNCTMRTNAVNMTMHLNDAHHWKRERIAAFLKTKGL
jgi:hypothetical protein